MGTMANWMRKKYPPSSSSFSGGSYYKRCFIVDVDGKKLPNKLDLYAFRRGKKITSNGESDKEEESEDEGQEGAKKSNSNNTLNTSSTNKILSVDDVHLSSLGRAKFGYDE